MTTDERIALARRIVERSPADATEAIVTVEQRALTRYAHEAVHQNVAAGETVVRVRAIVDGRTGVASTGNLDEAGIDAAIARACELARFAPAPWMAPSVAGPASPVAPAQAYVDATAAASADDRGAFARSVFAAARANGCWSAGYVATGSSGVTIATSSGAALAFDGTEAAANVKMVGADSSGFAEQYDADVRTFDGAAIAGRAAQKAVASAAPVAVEPGPWTVILEPPAFGELLHFLESHFSAQTVDEGASFVSGRLGERVFDEGVTLRDDYADPLHRAMPFDWEGTPTQRLALVENGVARTIVTDREWAARLDCPNTGHALPAPSAAGPRPRNFVVDPGTASLDELIAGTSRGLLISRFWYVRNVDQRRTILTGMTRDGTFLIENGRLAGGVRNLRFNQSLHEALGRCTLGRESRRTGGSSYAAVVPPVKLERFVFASTTAY